MRVWLTIAALLALGAAPAYATFPGRDGRLTLYRKGAPLRSMRPDGTGLRPQCPAIRACAHPQEQPAWSADGNKLAFRAGGSAVIVYADGTCRACPVLSESPYPAESGFAWSPDGRQLTDGDTIFGDDLLVEGSVPGVDPVGPGPEPAISARGAYASFVDGDIVVGSRHVAHRALFPDWSPDGRRLAYEHDDSVWTVGADGRHRRRITRGSAPVWSPSGERLAFVRDGHVMLVPSAGGPVTPAGHARADRIAWRPLVRQKAPQCAFGPGATVALQAPGVTIAERQTMLSETSRSWTACLNGVARTIWHDSEDGIYTPADELTRFSADAPFAAFAVVTGRSHYGDEYLEIVTVDLRSGRSVSSPIYSGYIAPRQVDALDVDSVGDTAWIESREDGSQATVGVQHAGASTTLAQGVAGEFADVAVGNGVVTWTDNGQPQSAPIASPG